MIRRLVFAAPLLLLLTSHAQAATIDLVLTINHYAPTVGPSEIGIEFNFFENATNAWGVAFPPDPALAKVGWLDGLLPGVSQYLVSLNTASLDNVYLRGSGAYAYGPGGSLFVAEPPSGSVPDLLAFNYGPPWIPLANLGAGLSGDLKYIYGLYNGPIGTWTLAPATPVPEPASMLLFGGGLAAFAVRRYRQPRA